MAYALNKAEKDFCHEYARSLVNAENSFIERVAGISGASIQEARKVFALYSKEKLIKFDRTNSRYVVKHGAFLDKEVILRAVALIA